MDISILTKEDLQGFKSEILDEIKSLGEKKQKKLLKSKETREILGNISPAKLQSLRIGGHLPAINADGLWLYDRDDIHAFIDLNKIGRKEARHEL